MGSFSKTVRRFGNTWQIYRHQGWSRSLMSTISITH